MVAAGAPAGRRERLSRIFRSRLLPTVLPGYGVRFTLGAAAWAPWEARGDYRGIGKAGRGRTR
jgi:hypothetical protein